MLFNSLGFLFLFVPVVYGLYWALRTLDQRKLLLIVASYVFYGVWSWKFAALMLATTSVDYFTARRVEQGRARGAWLALSMVANLGVLAIFKYLDFALDTVNTVAGRPLLPLLRLVLPIGISFYTFESMSYVIDVYRGRSRALHRFIDYAHFVTMFPRLVAGPIVRYSDLATQLDAVPARLTAPLALEAVWFFTVGLAKKILVADPIARHLVDPLFGSAADLGLCSGWVAALAYTAQLYFDFSGYSDMAVGLAIGLGLRLPRNFVLPYRASNPSDFWRRWHVSLSTWLRDYLFIPLGGNRGAQASVVRNLMLTMVLGGLWHGASWTFVVWGTYHGLGLVLYHLARGRVPVPPAWLARAGTFGFVVVGWVLFRAATLVQARSVLLAMTGRRGLDVAWAVQHLPWLGVLGAALALSMTVDVYELPVPRRTRSGIVLALVLALCISRLGQPSPFLYFQF